MKILQLQTFSVLLGLKLRLALGIVFLLQEVKTIALSVRSRLEKPLEILLILLVAAAQMVVEAAVVETPTGVVSPV